MSKKTLIMFLAVVVALAASSVYFFLKYKGVSEELKKKTEGADKAEVMLVLDKVSRLMEVPTDEEPTVATVTDKEKLKEQKFFAKAENEDKVIIFVKAQKAILYRPSTNKIIEVARIDTIDQKTAQQATVSAEIKTTQKTGVLILNGTTRVGLSNGLVEKMNLPESVFMLLQRQSAKRADYEKTMIVDLGVGAEVSQKMKELLKLGEVVNKMPEGEATPSGQLVVILGADYVNANN